MPDTVPAKPNFKGLTALVAGGSGFLGSHLCEALLSQNINVIAVDNLVHSERENIKHLLTNPNFSFLNYDLNTNPLNLGEGTRVDYIFHVAGVEEKLGEKDLSLETLLVNSLGTKHLLDLARTQKAKFLLVSSADIYSGALSSSSLNYYFGRFQKNEKLLTHHEAKRYAEALTYEYFKKYDVDARICRVLDVYGPRINLDSDETLNQLIKEGLRTDKLTILGDGLKTLHPTYVTDVVYGLLKAVLQESTKGKIFNLISPHKITVLALVEEFKKAFAKNYDLVFEKDNDILDFPYHTLELEITFDTLNWKPKVGLIDGLIKTAESFRNPEKTVTPLPILAPLVTTKPKLGLKRPKISLPRFSFGHPSKQVKTIKRSHLRLTIFIASLLLLLLGVFYPSLSLWLNITNGQTNLMNSLTYLQGGDLTQAIKFAQRAEGNWEQASTDLNNLTWLATMLQKRVLFHTWEQEIFAMENLAKANSLTTKALSPIEDLAVNFKNPQDNFTSSWLSKLNTEEVNLSLAGDRLAVFEANVLELQRNGHKEIFSLSSGEINSLISQAKKRVADLRGIYQVLPESLGFLETKNYLLLEADGSTTRSNGGVLKNYLVFSVRNGGVVKEESGSVNSLEKEAKIPVPDEIKDILKKDNLPLADSLWEIGLEEGSRGLRDVFGKRGFSLDGVGLITSKSLNQLTAGKQIQLGDLTGFLRSKSVSEWEKILPQIEGILDQKQAALASFTNSLSTLLEKKRWSGAFVNEKELAESLLATKVSSFSQNLLADYLMVTSDSFTSDTTLVPTLDCSVSISSVGIIENTVKLTWENKNTTDVAAYSRVLVPLGSILETRELPDKTKVLVEQVANKTQFGLPVTLKAGETKNITLQYQLPLQVAKNKQTTYSMVIQKPVGEGASLFKVQVLFPNNVEVNKENSNFTFENSKAVVSDAVKSDQVYFLDFKKF